MSSEFGDPETRARILESARELAESMGPAMRLADVAAHAGVSRQAVYLHFGDRAGLVLALLEHMQLAYGVHAMTERVTGARTPAQRLRRLVDLLATLNGHVDRVGWLFDEAQHLDEAFGRDWRNRARGVRAFIEQQVRAVAEAGALDPRWDVAGATDFVFAVTSLGSWRELTRDLGLSNRAYLQRVRSWVVDLLLASPDASGDA